MNEYVGLGHIDGLVQERLNSLANALELCLSCTNPLMCCSVHRLEVSGAKALKWGANRVTLDGD